MYILLCLCYNKLFNLFNCSQPVISLRHLQTVPVRPHKINCLTEPFVFPYKCQVSKNGLLHIFFWRTKHVLWHSHDPEISHLLINPPSHILLQYNIVETEKRLETKNNEDMWYLTPKCSAIQCEPHVKYLFCISFYAIVFSFLLY